MVVSKDGYTGRTHTGNIHEKTVDKPNWDPYFRTCSQSSSVCQICFIDDNNPTKIKE